MWSQACTAADLCDLGKVMLVSQELSHCQLCHQAYPFLVSTQGQMHVGATVSAYKCWISLLRVNTRPFLLSQTVAVHKLWWSFAWSFQAFNCMRLVVWVDQDTITFRQLWLSSTAVMTVCFMQFQLVLVPPPSPKCVQWIFKLWTQLTVIFIIVAFMIDNYVVW